MYPARIRSPDKTNHSAHINVRPKTPCVRKKANLLHVYYIRSKLSGHPILTIDDTTQNFIRQSTMIRARIHTRNTQTPAHATHASCMRTCPNTTSHIHTQVLNDAPQIANTSTTRFNFFCIRSDSFPHIRMILLEGHRRHALQALNRRFEIPYVTVLYTDR